ncbi:hypothetical protein HOC80_04220 [archaeon]|jgi:hypothetical protein|nr:hypothetical protein [archaeon]MBT4417280.1 hypothetical protein [archaeon]
MDTREFTEQATRSATEIVRYCHTNDIIEYVDEFILLMALDVSSELCSTGNRASIRADSNREVFDLLDKDPQKKEMILRYFKSSPLEEAASSLVYDLPLRETVLTLYETQVQPYLDGAN